MKQKSSNLENYVNVGSSVEQGGKMSLSSLRKIASKYLMVPAAVLSGVASFLFGPEIRTKTESIIYNGKIYSVAFADRNYNKKNFYPFFIEDGGEMPTSLSECMSTSGPSISALAAERPSPNSSPEDTPPASFPS